MTIRFLHSADIHLGYQQYNSKERYNDFARAFEQMVDDALARHVDFVLVAGDLFHKRVIGPRTLLQATRTLGRLRSRGIPVIAIEGNHDRSFQREAFSWLDYLAEEGLLILLDATIRAGEPLLPPWGEEDQFGAYVDLPGGVRVMGVKYCGASTPRVVKDLAEALAGLSVQRPAYTILMLHAGLQGILDSYAGTLTRAQLDDLRPYVDYLALGHVHKPFIQDEWIYNPGSLETNSVAEVEWEDRGYLLVEVDPSTTPAHSVTKIPSQRRLFTRLSFGVDRYETPEALYLSLEDYLKGQAMPEIVAREPVVELRLSGVLAFDRIDLDMSYIEEIVTATFHPLVCNAKDVTTPSEFEIRVDEAFDRAKVEHHVLCELVERDARRRGDSEHWTQMLLRLKRMALDGSEPEEIEDEIRAFGWPAEPADGEEAAC